MKGSDVNLKQPERNDGPCCDNPFCIDGWNCGNRLRCPYCRDSGRPGWMQRHTEEWVRCEWCKGTRSSDPNVQAAIEAAEKFKAEHPNVPTVDVDASDELMELHFERERERLQLIANLRADNKRLQLNVSALERDSSRLETIKGIIADLNILTVHKARLQNVLLQIKNQVMEESE